MPLSSVVGAQSIVKPGVCTSSTRPASPFEGQCIYETDTLLSKVWTGSAWVEYPPGKANTASPTFTGTVTLPTTNVTGVLTSTSQPCFFVYLHNGTAISATNKVVFNTVVTNNGSHWSSANNRFTAPVAGLYKFDYSMLSGTASVTNVELRKNGSTLIPPTYNQEQYESAVGNQILSLSATDYIEMWVTAGVVHGFHNFFTGFLIG